VKCGIRFGGELFFQANIVLDCTQATEVALKLKVSRQEFGYRPLALGRAS